MAEILLCSEARVKAESSISDNLASKYLLPSIREAQDVKLRGILGDALLERLKVLVRDSLISQTAYAAYKSLLDRAQYFIVYSTIVEVAMKVSFKISNVGVHKTSDENVQSVSADELAKTQEYYQGKADAYCYQLQNWIYENRASFPELTENDLRSIHSNLYSAASCGIWLGGPRGKRQ